VYDTPGLELRAGRKLLRLREYGGANILTFKGPPESGPHKTREEIETVVASAPETRILLDRLGYRVVFRYEKYRTEYGGDKGLALIDETPIGVFIELEGDPDWIDASAVRLGYGRPDYITDSYGGLYFAWCGARRIEPSNMEFARS